MTNLHHFPSQSKTSCPTTWRPFRDHRLLWCHFTLSIEGESPEYLIKDEALGVRRETIIFSGWCGLHCGDNIESICFWESHTGTLNTR